MRIEIWAILPVSSTGASTLIYLYSSALFSFLTAELNPPVIIDARYVSLNAIRFTWTSPETENFTHLRTFMVVLSETNCSKPIQKEQLGGSTEVSESLQLIILLSRALSKYLVLT